MTTVRMDAAGDTQFSRLNPPGSFSPSGLRFCLPPRWRGRCACERDEMMPRKIEAGGSLPDGRWSRRQGRRRLRVTYGPYVTQNRKEGPHMSTKSALRADLDAEDRKTLAEDRKRMERLWQGRQLDDWLAFGPGLLIRRRLAKNIAGLAETDPSSSVVSVTTRPHAPA